MSFRCLLGRYGLVLAAFAPGACLAPRGAREPRVGLALSALPNLGLEAQGSVRLAVRGETDWRAELAVAEQFLDDENLARDGNPGAGDWTQVGLSLRALTSPAERHHWTARIGAIWFRARGEPNVIDLPGDYVGLRLGLGFETDLGRSWSFGPELALIPAYGEGEFVLVPQVTWGVRWRL